MGKEFRHSSLGELGFWKIRVRALVFDPEKGKGLSEKREGKNRELENERETTGVGVSEVLCLFGFIFSREKGFFREVFIDERKNKITTWKLCT